MGTGVGTAVLDEAQQERVMFENAKFSLDAGDLDFQFLLESSQIFRFKKIRESSADRISNYTDDVGNIFLVKLLTRLSLYNLVTDRISIDKEANFLADFPEITIR